MTIDLEHAIIVLLLTITAFINVLTVAQKLRNDRNEARAAKGLPPESESPGVDPNG